MKAEAAFPFKRVTRRINTPFCIALAAAVSLYSVAFLVLRVLIPEQEIAGTLAAMLLGAGPYVQKGIEERLPGHLVAPRRLGDYAILWWILLAGGTLSIWLASSAVTYIQLRAGPVTAVSSTIDTLLRLLAPAAAVIVGVIVGQRCERRGLLVVMGACILGFLAAELTSPLVQGLAIGTMPPLGSDPGVPPALLPGTEMPPDPRPLYLGEGFVRFLLDRQLPLLLAVGMLGFWRGTRTRLASYVGSLLADAPAGDREAIVELAYESAVARRRAVMREPGPVGPPQDGYR